MSTAPSIRLAPILPRRAERGVVTVAAVLLALTMSGLALGLLLDGLAARQHAVRGEDGFRALELAETAAARLESELASEVDHGLDGLGTISGAVGNGTFEARSVRDAASPDRWVVTATGRMGLAVRTLEVGYRQLRGGAFVEGLFSHRDLVFNGKTFTDAYDSGKGTYGAQAVNTDAYGTFAELGGHVGSNSGFVQLTGSAVTIRGNAIPGPGRSVLEYGTPTVMGDTTPRLSERDIPPTSLAEYQAALGANNNGNWWRSGGAYSYNSATKALSLSGGGTLTFPGGTYFFSSVKVSGNSTLRFTGPSRIYVTKEFDTSGGTLVNATPEQKPANLMIHAHPYDLPAGTLPTTTQVSIAGGSGSAWVMYGPQAALKVSGGSQIYGAAVADQITINGDCWFHYDKALDNFHQVGAARLERQFWRELTEPRR